MKLATLEKKDQSAFIQGSVLYKLDVFKGVYDSAGTVTKIRSVGSAVQGEGSSTIHMSLKTLLKDRFYLLPEQSQFGDADFAVLTREETRIPGRKFFWHRIGDAYRLTGANTGFLELQFDLFGAEKIYMDLRALSVRENSCEEEALKCIA